MSASNLFKNEYKQALQNVPPTEVSATTRHIKVASQQFKRNTTTVGVFFETGARYEDASKNGAGNLVTRLLYKGSIKRSQADLESEVRKMGASLRAFTDRDRTGFYATCLNDDVPQVVELLADVIQNPRFDAADLEKERAKVLYSMGEIEHNIKDVVIDNLYACAFQETPLEQNVIGKLDVVEGITTDDLHYFVKKHFNASNVVVASSGGISNTQLTELAEKHFNKLDNTFDGSPVEYVPCRFTGSEIRWRDDSLPYGYFAIAVKVPGAGSPDSIKLQVAQSLLGSYDRSQGTNGPHFKEFYGKHFRCNLSFNCMQFQNGFCFKFYLPIEWCHSFQTFTTQHRGVGLLGFYAVAERMQLEDISENYLKRMRKLAHTADAREVASAKNRWLTTYMDTIDSTKRIFPLVSIIA